MCIPKYFETRDVAQCVLNCKHYFVPTLPHWELNLCPNTTQIELLKKILSLSFSMLYTEMTLIWSYSYN